MSDVFSKELRSDIMSRIGNKDTKPELRVRRLLHALGYRFRLHRKTLPGTPDIVLPGRKAVIFVHGCFWHRHQGCKRASMPATNVEFWEVKFNNNRLRDTANIDALQELGYKCLVVWECETKKIDILADKLSTFLNEG